VRVPLLCLIQIVARVMTRCECASRQRRRHRGHQRTNCETTTSAAISCVGAKRTRFICPATSHSESIGAFERRSAEWNDDRNVPRVLKRGSSKHGNARRASVGVKVVRRTSRRDFCDSDPTPLPPKAARYRRRRSSRVRTDRCLPALRRDIVVHGFRRGSIRFPLTSAHAAVTFRSRPLTRITFLRGSEFYRNARYPENVSRVGSIVNSTRGATVYSSTLAPAKAATSNQRITWDSLSTSPRHASERYLITVARYVHIFVRPQRAPSSPLCLRSPTLPKPRRDRPRD